MRYILAEQISEYLLHSWNSFIDISLIDILSTNNLPDDAPTQEMSTKNHEK